MSPTTENLNPRKEKLPKKLSKRELFRVFATALIALVATGCAQDVDTAASERFMTATSQSTATEGIEEASSTPEASATATATATETPTKTATPTETATPTQTATPEMKEPVIDFDWKELIESMPISAESKAKLKEDLENQFDGGLYVFEGAYALRGITLGEMVIYDSGEGLPSDQPLVLPTGHEIPATIRCAFVIKTASGELVETEVQIPIYVYHPDELTEYLSGSIPKIVDLHSIELYKLGFAQKWAGTMELLEYVSPGFVNPPQVIDLDLAIPEGTEFDHRSGHGYLNEAIRAMYSPEGLIKFAETGVWPFVFETPTGELINLLLPVGTDSLKHMYP